MPSPRCAAILAVMILDTHDTVKRLMAVQFSETQAEAITTLLRDLQNNEHAQMATKDDVAVVKGDLERLKRDLTIRFGGLMIGGVAFLVILKVIG